MEVYRSFQCLVFNNFLNQVVFKKIVFVKTISQFSIVSCNLLL